MATKFGGTGGNNKEDEYGANNQENATTNNGGLCSTERTFLIAVYGTLKRGYGNHRLMHNATFIQEDFVPFIKITGSGFPIAKFEGASGDKLLKVEVYRVNSLEDLKRMDALEGHPTWYRRTPVITQGGLNVEIYDMFSRDFEDNSDKFKIPSTEFSPYTNHYEWK